jgi:glycosyltransferase involved in cell wall biosynthesis
MIGTMGPVPLLSICIPTYNRCGLLMDSLKMVIPQLKELGDKVELLVSDNCSSDDTRERVEELSKEYPIKYFLNDKNYGANQNIMFFVQSRANGKFCWILGDDDHVREGGIKNILSVLERNSDIDFLFLNFLNETQKEMGKNRSAVDMRRYHSSDTINRAEGRRTFDQILANDVLSLAGIFTSIFRVSVCREASQRYVMGKEFSNLQSTFPLTILLIDSMRGHPCYYVGESWLILGTKTTWSRYAFVGLKRFLDLYEYQEGAGIEPAMVDVQRRRFLLDRCGYLTECWLLDKMRKLDTPFIGEFDPFEFFLKYFNYREFWINWLYLYPKGFFNKVLKA